MASDAAQSAAPVHRFVLLTDIVQSSRLAEQYGQRYLRALEEHNQLVEQAVAQHGGELYKQTGDGYLILFETADACLEAALGLGEILGKLDQLADDEPLLVRLALHAGELKPSGQEYFGPALNRASRICQVCNPGQVLLSGVVASYFGGAGVPARDAMAGIEARPIGFRLIDLGQHHLRDLAEPEKLYQLDSERLCRHEFPPLTTLDNRPNNLVRQPNAFIGRERELKELAQLLLDGKPLVSITAPGGYGKSRLAAQLCANLLHRFANGVFMAYLAPVRESLGVPTEIASALGFQFSGNRDPEDQLCDYLREKELLLCLDNFEHVLGSTPLVAELLQAAPNLKVVITSREPLRLQGEHIFRLEPLPIEAAGGEQYSEAQTLFADRAALVSSGFALSADNAAEVQKICEQLSGIPLAIELAAAWMDGFTIAELSDELSRQLELEARASDRPERHQSLKACLDWSWKLLGNEQQAILMKLSTFRGGFFGEAASELLGQKGMALRSTLMKLSDKSWLFTREVEGQTRFFLRDMLAHEYAFGKLHQSQLYEPAVMAHAAYFSALMAHEGPRLEGDGTPTGQSEALATIRLEQQNIDEALDTLLRRLQLRDAGEDTAALLLAIARWFSKFHTMTAASREQVECCRGIQNVAEQDGHLQQILLHALLGCSVGQWRLGDYDAARGDCRQANLIAEATGDRYGIALSKRILAVIEHSQGNYEGARKLSAESLAISREIGDRFGIGASLSNLGTVAELQGNCNAAVELYSESLAIQRESGDRSGTAKSFSNLGNMECIQGNYDAARELYAESLVIQREIGNRHGVAASLGNLGNVEHCQGNEDAAREFFAETLAIMREIGDRYGIALTMGHLGNLELNKGNCDAAREFFAETLAIMREIGNRYGIALALAGQGMAEGSQGNNDIARELFSESLAIQREIGYREGIAASLNSLGDVECIQGNFDTASGLYAESLAFALEIGDRKAQAYSLQGLAEVHSAFEEYTQAEELRNQALKIRREIGDRHGIAASLNDLGDAKYRQGNFEAARELYAEALAIKREIRHRMGEANALQGLAIVCCAVEQQNEAKELQRQALEIRREIGDRSGLCVSLVAYASLLSTLNLLSQGAVCLYGARVRAEQSGYHFDPIDRDLLERALAVVEHPHTGLAGAEREQLKAQAEAMSLDELAEFALDALDELRAVLPEEGGQSSVTGYAEDG